MSSAHEKLYDGKFYESQSVTSHKSASKVLAFLYSIFYPKSVADFGCGVGTWLAASEKEGAQRLVGFDGDWVNVNDLYSPNIQFNQCDFRKLEEIKPPKVELAISLEVAEHISEEYADSFVKLLCKSSDVVLFGAAIEEQGGVGHINEQPQSYWVDKFKENSYRCFDIIRPTFWNDCDVNVWYRQNSFVFVDLNNKALIELFENISHSANLLDVVHPDLYKYKMRNEVGLKPREVDLVRDIAVAIEGLNTEKALLLMELALENRPNGEFIKNKVKHYKSLLK